jgi:hypothetical protein
VRGLRVSPDEAQALIVDLSSYLDVVSLQSEDYKTAISQMVALKLPGGDQSSFNVER